MALGKYSRVDGRKSSSGYCSTVTIVVFVALCLVGVWMMTSSSVVPPQTSDVTQENKDDIKAPLPESNAEIKNNDVTTGNEDSNNGPSGNNSSPTEEGKQFEDNPGDLPEEATKGDNNVSSNPVEKYDTTEESVNNTEESQDQKPGNDERKESESNNESESVEEKKGDGESQDPESGGNRENTSNGSEEKPEEDSGKTDGETDGGQPEEKVENKKDEKSTEEKDKPSEVFPSGAQSELSDESTTQNGSFSTQATESKNEKDAQKPSQLEKQSNYSWKLCKTSAGPDYIPCLDNLEAIKKLSSTKHYEHRERHCPDKTPTCFVPLPEGYQRSIEWPTSREKV